MWGSSILDIAIGVVFVFLLLSLFASTINEIFQSFLSMRGKVLLEGDKNSSGRHGCNGIGKGHLRAWPGLWLVQGYIRS